MLDLAKAIHEALGIQSPKMFIAVFAIGGLLVGGALGWIVDRQYRVRVHQQTANVAVASGVASAQKIETSASTDLTPKTSQGDRARPNVSAGGAVDSIHTSGPCSPVISGNGNAINVRCTGTEKAGREGKK